MQSMRAETTGLRKVGIRLMLESVIELLVLHGRIPAQL